MKDKRVIKSFDTILPNEEVKLRIKNSSMRQKRKDYYLAVMLPACVLLLFVLFKIEDTTIIKNIRSNENSILYNNTKYCEVGIYDGDKTNLEFIESTDEYLMGREIYKLDSNNIVFKNSDNFIKYEKC